VCSYTGVFCAQALDDNSVTTVAGIDLNGGDIAGYLPPELGLLTDIALFHINSNRFCGIIPDTFSRLTILHELDVSNNRFVGLFPKVVLQLPALKYVDNIPTDFILVTTFYKFRTTYLSWFMFIFLHPSCRNIYSFIYLMNCMFVAGTLTLGTMILKVLFQQSFLTKL
jgi:hypothetical protein